MAGAVPRAEYSRRLGELSARRAKLQYRERLVGYSQLALAGLTVIWMLFGLRHFTRADLLILLPVAAFVGARRGPWAAASRGGNVLPLHPVL